MRPPPTPAPQAGVVMATSGPGALNLVTGLADAMMDSTPVVAITGNVPRALIGTDAFQEADVTGVTMPITKHNYLVQDVNEIPRVVKEAFHIAATGRPGPVLIDIPKDVQLAEFTGSFDVKLALPGYKPTLKGHPKQIERALDALEKAERPVLMVGGGAQHAHAELLAFAEVDQRDALRRASHFADRRDLRTDQHAAGGDQHDFIFIVNQLGTDDDAVAFAVGNGADALRTPT